MRHVEVLLLAFAGLPHLATAQEPIPIRKLGPAIATSRATFGLIGGVRELRDGRLLVNDIENRKLLVLNATLAESSTLADDSTGGSAPAYGGSPARMITYRGDSTLLVEPDLLSMQVIGPRGTLGHARAIPNAEQVKSLVSAAAGTPGFDRGDHLVYRVLPPAQQTYRANGVWTIGKESPDSAPIVRASLKARKVDTVAYTRITPAKLVVVEGPKGKMIAATAYNPLPVSDEWVVVSDGSIAILRSSDYHVDWITPDSKRSSSPRIAFDWHRLTGKEKTGMIEGVVRDVAVARSRSSGATAALPFPMVAASDLPDYTPPFARGSILADEDGRIWVQTSAIYANVTGVVYDVIDRQGRLIDRVEIPNRRLIVGFGQSGVVYLASEGTARQLEKTRIR
ncbi:MAG: hypothetical protein ABJE10_11085 [bacterium]